MTRRVVREKKSRFFGTKQVLTIMNQPAHSVVHDLDIAPRAGYGFRATDAGGDNHNSTGNWLTVPFDTEEYDDGVFASNTFTVPQGMPGLWHLEARLEFAGDATSTGRREIRFRKNGATTIDNHVQGTPGTTAVSLSMSTIVKLAGNDTVILEAYQNSGGNLNYNGTASDIRRFAAAYFGPRPS